LPATKKQSRPQVTIVRDPTFHRAVADKVIVIDLGRDVEFAFLQSGPVIKKMIDWDEESERAELAGGLTEVARIRMGGPTALTVAVNIIETLFRSGKVKIPAFMGAISKMAAEHGFNEGQTDE
jgi:hypothetical protein